VDALLGKTLSHYRIIEEIGAGGMGAVYRAHDESLRRDVAVKVLPPSFATDPDRLRRFEQEARATGALNHPNILAIYDFGEHEGSPYVVSELLEGRTLRDQMGGRALPVRKAVEYGIQIARGLSAAHEKGIVHRDLKPENLFITSDGRVKILDFGLAKLIRAESDPGAGETSVTTQTEPGVVLGTMGYMAPEQIRGEAVDQRADIFSLGAVLYEMLSGRRAFSGATSADTMSAILSHDPPSLSTLHEGIPPDLDRAIRRCLEKGPRERSQSAWDLASELERLAEARAPASHVRARRWLVPAAAGLGIVVLLGLAALTDLGGWRSQLQGERHGVPIRSLAVLPLENISRDPEQEYFVDGMTQELIASLGKIGALRVISRSSVMSLKGTRKPLPEIARMLKVDAVVEGSAMRSGDRVRITAALVQAAPERQLWSDSYERGAGDVLALQADIARDIAQQIRVRLAPEESQRLASIKPVDPGAYDLYLRGRVYLDRPDWTQNRKAIEMFEKAIELQPNFALAWAGLAEAHYWISNVYVAPREAMPKAREAARKAIELDKNLSEAHAVMGAVASMFDWDWEKGEREYREAIRLNASNASAHLYYSIWLVQRGQEDLAITEVKRAHELNPLSAAVANHVPFLYYIVGKCDSALVFSLRLVESDPEFWQYRSTLSVCYSELGMHEEAIMEARRLISPANSRSRRPLAYAYACAGRRNEALAELSHSLRGPQELYPHPYSVALTYAILGEKERAFEWLDRAYEDRSEDLLYVNVDPSFRSLRSDSRFQNLVRRIGLHGETKDELRD
jgi:eukaryotic-like serine/threonine-protein kinase